jgi:hypothetical protein
VRYGSGTICAGCIGGVVIVVDADVDGNGSLVQSQEFAARCCLPMGASGSFHDVRSWKTYMDDNGAFSTLANAQMHQHKS